MVKHGTSLHVTPQLLNDLGLQTIARIEARKHKGISATAVICQQCWFLGCAPAHSWEPSLRRPPLAHVLVTFWAPRESNGSHRFSQGLPRLR